MPEDGGKDNDNRIMVTGNGKTKNLLNPKPNPKVHNAFAILSQPNAPTHYDTPCPTQQIDDNKITFPVRESLTHSITYIHTTTDTTFYVGIKTKIVEKWPNQSLLLSCPFSPPPTTNATKTQPL
jgi:hypothetical protein